MSAQQERGLTRRDLLIRRPTQALLGRNRGVIKAVQVAEQVMADPDKLMRAGEIVVKGASQMVEVFSQSPSVRKAPEAPSPQWKIDLESGFSSSLQIERVLDRISLLEFNGLAKARAGMDLSPNLDEIRRLSWHYDPNTDEMTTERLMAQKGLVAIHLEAGQFSQAEGILDDIACELQNRTWPASDYLEFTDRLISAKDTQGRDPKTFLKKANDLIDEKQKRYEQGYAMDPRDYSRLAEVHFRVFGTDGGFLGKADEMFAEMVARKPSDYFLPGKNGVSLFNAWMTEIRDGLALAHIRLGNINQAFELLTGNELTPQTAGKLKTAASIIDTLAAQRRFAEAGKFVDRADELWFQLMGSNDNVTRIEAWKYKPQILSEAAALSHDEGGDPSGFLQAAKYFMNDGLAGNVPLASRVYNATVFTRALDVTKGNVAEGYKLFLEVLGVPKGELTTATPIDETKGRGVFELVHLQTSLGQVDRAREVFETVRNSSLTPAIESGMLTLLGEAEAKRAA